MIFTFVLSIRLSWFTDRNLNNFFFGNYHNSFTSSFTILDVIDSSSHGSRHKEIIYYNNNVGHWQKSIIRWIRIQNAYRQYWALLFLAWPWNSSSVTRIINCCSVAECWCVWVCVYGLWFSLFACWKSLFWR